MVNPDVDGYAKTLNHRKIIWKTQKNSNLLKTNECLNRNIAWGGGPVFTFKLPGFAPLPPSVTSLAMIYFVCIQQAVPTLLQQA